MSTFEKIILAMLAASETLAPVFIHSGQGSLVLNASETLLAQLLVEFTPAPKPAA
jgi:hypothetical protein